MKTCTKCGEEKDVNLFSKNKHNIYNDGYEYQCKSCCKYYRIEHRDIMAAYRKLYYSSNKDKCNKISKEWRKKNPEKVKISKRKYESKLAFMGKKKYNIETAKKYREKHKEHLADLAKINRINKIDKYEFIRIKSAIKKQIGETPPPELVEVKLLISKTKTLCQTSKTSQS